MKWMLCGCAGPRDFQALVAFDLTTVSGAKMVSLVVCLDGTDQTKTQQYPTNIARIFDALGGQAGPDGNDSFATTVGNPATLLGKYLPGVGTQGDPVLKLLGNAFGDGIAEPIIRGYTFLSRSYRPGDEIFITGFSRGATAARALAGFVAAHGLLDSTKYITSAKTTAYLRAVAAWYAYRNDRSLADLARLNLMATVLETPIPTLVATDYTAPPQIKAVGVFDTVSSLGLPHIDANGDAVFDFSIIDTSLNSRVQFGFHALAADETRDLFAPTFWAARQGVAQEVFPGAHSNVGGGYPERGLSDGALDWMLTKFGSTGLAFNRSNINPAIRIDPLDVARDDAVTFPFKDTPRHPRKFPESASPNPSIIARKGRPVEVLPSVTPTAYKPIGTYADGTPLC